MVPIMFKATVKLVVFGNFVTVSLVVCILAEVTESLKLGFVSVDNSIMLPPPEVAPILFLVALQVLYKVIEVFNGFEIFDIDKGVGRRRL